MRELLPQRLINFANACPFPLYLVGGFVRDYLAGISCADKDYDICAPVSADKFCDAARGVGAHISAVYRATGTVKIRMCGTRFEFASFRSDEYVRGAHRPEKSFFTDDISLDARRRDFCCNAVYYDIKADKFIDVLGGIEDIKNKRISTVAPAEKVFGEDGLRLMRLARQAAQLGFTPTEECLAGAKKNAHLVSDVTPERIYTELNAILLADKKYGVSGAQYAGLKILDETRVLDYMLPELAAGRRMKQPKGFHDYDVLEHSLRTVLYADEDIRLAALLHDIGKPECMKKMGNYHGHEAVGAEIAEKVLRRLCTPKKLREEVIRLTQLHMYDVTGVAREGKIRKLIVGNGDIWNKLLKLKQADFSACRDRTEVAPCVEKWTKIYQNMAEEGAPFSERELDVKGNELIDAGIQPKAVGKILQRLLWECAQQPGLNKKEKLISRARALSAM